MHHVILWLGDKNFVIETLNKLSETSSDFAGEMFNRLKDCTRCCDINNPVTGKCGHLQVYEYSGNKRGSCSGSFSFKMFPSDFEDVKKVVKAINDVVAAKEMIK